MIHALLNALLKLRKKPKIKRKNSRLKIVLVLNQADWGNKKVSKRGKKTTKIHLFTFNTLQINLPYPEVSFMLLKL